MKKYAFLFLLGGSLYLAACNNATQKTGHDSPDSGSAGSSGAVADTMGASSGATTLGSDTSHNGKPVADPGVDSAKKKTP
jgi:predicted small secreted protein